MIVVRREQKSPDSVELVYFSVLVEIDMQYVTPLQLCQCPFGR